MTAFQDFLRGQVEYGGFSTEDVLLSFLPLMRQVIATHQDGAVAPLEGLGELDVEGACIRYSDDAQQSERRNLRAVRRMLNPSSQGVDVVGQSRLVLDVDMGGHKYESSDVANVDEDLQQPAFVVGYVCWEHMFDQHDPATDVFSLGLILASLACGLDLADKDDHERFVTHRTNLFRINPGLHPVFARAIRVMTELDRHERPQDLPALLVTLENYRDQEVDFDTDLASDQRAEGKDRPGKRQIILGKLQQRLFEINRRNRLLHFRTTMQTVNLTHSSIPLLFDVKNVRADQVLTWDGTFRSEVLKQEAVSLNRHLNFREAVYLPGTLDRIRSEARRDENEYGFAQLRLIVCFLRWADLKAKPVERYESPLLLLPVKLDVKKGIHDRYSLTAIDSVAEVNPVVRYQFKQLYDIDLPDQVELGKGRLDEFFEQLKQHITGSDAAVNLARIDKPRIELIHEKARRRLDQYRRRARMSGRGIRQFMDLDYSYDSINYHPLGVQIFEEFIKPARTHLEGVIARAPVSRVVPQPTPPATSTEAFVEAEQEFYHVRKELDDNPYNWEFDLCSVTLANLKYRRMSLVRDYTQLVADNTENAAFEATFSITPADRIPEDEETLPLTERFHVVPCDPTQAKAITHARSGDSYIIQGPPGTGKSQTIANLIADFVVRGQRVLFVCEKRAAIDVVYHRLKQQGLHELCCLIHDSQADKKQFVMDLKQTYETFLTEAGRLRDKLADSRRELLTTLATELKPLEDFNAAMTSAPDESGITVRSLLDRLIELRSEVPTLTPREWERIPQFVEWRENEANLAEFSRRLKQVQPDGILANHSLCLLSAEIADAERPVDLVTECLQDGRSVIESLRCDIDLLDLPSEVTTSLQQLTEAVDYAERTLFLAEHDLLELLDPETATARGFAKRLKKLGRSDKAVAKVQQATVHWKQKLSSDDTRLALVSARQFEKSVLSVFKPSWWRMRRILNASYDFSAHAVKPTWSHVLQQLDQEHEKLAARYDVATAIGDEFSIHLDFDAFHRDLMALRKLLERQPGPIQNLNRFVLAHQSGDRILRTLAGVRPQLSKLVLTLDRFLDGYEHRSVAQLGQDINSLSAALEQLPDYLHCLASLKPMPPSVTSAIRALALTLTQLEAAAAERTLQNVYRDDRELARFDGVVRDRQLSEIATITDRWMRINAAAVREFVRQRFIDHVDISAKPAAQLQPSEKDFKKSYNRGRRDVEHEFGKSMRYKSIRDLAAGDSGLVIRDLKPVWLMSPLSVSDTLPLTAHHFDVVIFDEASQITLEEAIPSLFRAEQTIVVGDEMQLPPTSFFSSKRDDEDDDLTIEEEGEVVQYDLNSNSFLNHAARNLPSRMLGWHYRSRSESLISFSNHAFYSGRLLTVPEEHLSTERRREILITSAEDGSATAAELLTRPVSFHFLENGCYSKRRNTPEAEYIAQLVRQLLIGEEDHSIGIVAFSEAQQEEIERAVRALAEDDAEFADLLEAELEREEDGHFNGLIVKNLENIQGDERDVIIMSVCYGPDPQGKTRMNFGPINMSGGEKRLNVAFSRAKHFMALVTSMRSSAITNDYNDGAGCLKNYLRYAEACSAGRSDTVANVLRSLSGRDDTTLLPTDDMEILVRQIADELNERGFEADLNVGQSHFRCDLAIRRDGDQEYRLGILVDNQQWYRQSDLLERELMKPQLLMAFGWNICVVLARDWYHNKDEVLQTLDGLLKDDGEQFDTEL
ncbi:MAG: AAA domain-containing protein [Fuerstiella sp.]